MDLTDSTKLRQNEQLATPMVMAIGPGALTVWTLDGVLVVRTGKGGTRGTDWRGTGVRSLRTLRGQKEKR